MRQFDGTPSGLRSLLVEMVVDGGKDGGEFWEASHAPKTLHHALTSSKRQVRVLDAIIEPAACPFFVFAQLSERSLKACQKVANDFLGLTSDLFVDLTGFLVCFQVWLLRGAL